MKVCVIIPAAGASSRFNGPADLEHPRSKLDEDMGGRPLLQRTIDLFATHELVSTFIVAGPHGDEAFADFRLRHGDRITLHGGLLCKGGVTHRYETVAAALAHVPADATHVCVHDAARPCTPPEVIERVFDAAQHHAAVICAVDVADTIKRVGEPIEQDHADPLAAILGAASDRPGPRPVIETLERRGLVAVQTPQVFEAGLLRRAYAQADLASTDDAALVEKLGEPVMVVEGSARNLKVTVPEDIELARAILGVSGPSGRATHKRF